MRIFFQEYRLIWNTEAVLVFVILAVKVYSVNCQMLFSPLDYTLCGWRLAVSLFCPHTWNHRFLLFWLQMIPISMSVVRGRIRKNMNATLLLLAAEDARCRPAETLAQGPTTVATTGLLDTCLVLLGKLSPGCTGCRACRDTDTTTQNKYGKIKHFTEKFMLDS